MWSIATQILGGVLLFPGLALPALGTVWPMREITLSVAEHVFGLNPPLLYRGNSGDTAFHWVQTFWILLLAIAVTAVWSAIERRGGRDGQLHTWFRLFLRLAVAAEMFYFGMAKVIPAQFPPPALVTLVEPVGDLSISNLLWVFVGASTPYQIFTGCAEVAGGLLLLLPRTTMLGAIICLVDMTHVFVLNMAYDVGLKQISCHLALMSLFLLAPDLQRLARLFVLNQPVSASPVAPLFRTPRANRAALVAQLVFGLYLLGMFTNLSVRFWYGEGGPGSPKSPLYGIWDVTELSVDGRIGPAVSNDYDRRWRRVIFDSPQRIIFQRTDDSFATYGVSIDTGTRTLTVSKGSSRLWKAAFDYERPSEDRLTLEGSMDGYRIRAELQLVGLDRFRLLNSGFRWIRPPDPFAG